MVRVNPVLERLGFSGEERVVIFHADDVGMCQATTGAYVELVEFGLLSSAATMVPCPWFPATAAYCRQFQNTGRIDMGVHLTLTSEWDTYRWGPISTTDPASGLLDEEGYFYRLAAPVRAGGDAAAAGREMQRQIERALATGIDVTHVDSHMFTIYHPKLLPVYLDLARQYRVPALMVRSEERMLSMDAYDRETTAMMARLVEAAEAEGLPFVDDIFVMPLVFPVEDRLAYARQVLAELRPGITCFIVHPAHDTAELRAMAPDWPSRVGDYQLFLTEAWREVVRQSGVQVIGYRALRDVMRESEAVNTQQ